MTLARMDSDGQDESMRDFPLTTVLLSVVEMFVFMSILLLLGATPFTAAVMTALQAVLAYEFVYKRIPRLNGRVPAIPPDWRVVGICLALACVLLPITVTQGI
jgi:hypothetical protein